METSDFNEYLRNHTIEFNKMLEHKDYPEQLPGQLTLPLDARKRLARVDQIIAEINASMERPGSRPMTSNDLRHRERNRHSIATTIKLKGGQPREDYK